MWTTLSIIFILALKSFFYEITNNKKWKNLIFVILVFYFSFKYKMGGDWYNYQSFYENDIKLLKLNDLFIVKFYFERGYVILNYIFYKIGFNYEFFQGTILSICLLYIFNFIERKSDNLYYTIALLLTTSFLFYMLEPLLRQFIAITLIIYSLKYIENNQYIKYFFIVFVASQFHRSANIFYLFYFFKYININEKNFILYTFYIYLILLLIPTLILNLEIFSKYNKYFTIERYIGHIKRGLFLEIIKFLILYIRIIFIVWTYGNSQKRSKIIEMMALFFCMLSYFTNILPLLVRFQGYFLIPYSIALSSLGNFKLFKKYKSGVIGKIFMYLLLILLVFLLNKNVYITERGKAKYVHYHNYIIELISGRIASKEIEKIRLREYFDMTQEMEKKAQERIKKERSYK